MNDTKFKSLIQSLLESESVLLSFIEECIKEIFPLDANRAISQFQEEYNMKEWNGFYPTLTCLKNNVKLEKERAKAWEITRNKENENKDPN